MSKRNFYKRFIEDEKQFYLHMAGFNSREACLFKLRAYEDKTLWEAADIMGYSLRTIDRINRDMKRKIEKTSFYIIIWRISGVLSSCILY